MLKQALIVLQLIMGVYVSAWGQTSDHSDSIKTVTVKVTLIPKTAFSDSLHRKHTRNEHKKHKRIKRHHQANPANELHEEVLMQSDLSSSNLLDSLQKEIESRMKKSSESPNQTSRNIYLFSGFILLIAGILVTLFFRTGISLISGIVMIVSGYYILIYSLLFLNWSISQNSLLHTAFAKP